MNKQRSDIPPRPNLILRFGLFFLLIALLAAGGFFAFKRWQPGHLLRKAEKQKAAGDLRGAALFARAALQADPGNVGACRLIASLAEAGDSPELLFWRRRIVDLDPGLLADELALARAALRAGDLEAAEKALLLASRHAEGSAEYHAAAGSFAVMHNRIGEAMGHFETALRLAPDHPTYRYNLATLQIQMPDPAARRAGSAHLAALADDPAYALFALRGLVTHSLHSGEPGEALPLARRLAAAPGATFSDRLLSLQALADARSPDLDGQIADAREAAASAGARETGKLIAWMLANGKAAEAIRWWEGLGIVLRADGLTASPVAWSHLRGGDWEKVLAVTALAAPDAKGERIGIQHREAEPDWGALEYLRSLYRAKAFRETGDTPGFRAEWGRSLTLVTRKGVAAQRIYRLASDWGWQPEAIALLAAVAESAPRNDWALRILAKHYADRRDTQGLLKVFAKMSENDPSDRAAANNRNMLRLLTGIDPGGALRSAEQLAKEQPGNAAFLSTYALALHLAGKTGEGIALMETLPAPTLEIPSVAAYHAILLAAAGRKEEAAPFFDRATNAKLLPEEEALLRSAKTR